MAYLTRLVASFQIEPFLGKVKQAINADFFEVGKPKVIAGILTNNDGNYGHWHMLTQQGRAMWAEHGGTMSNFDRTWVRASSAP